LFWRETSRSSLLSKAVPLLEKKGKSLRDDSQCAPAWTSTAPATVPEAPALKVPKEPVPTSAAAESPRGARVVTAMTPPSADAP
jgi:hypothetical protein